MENNNPCSSAIPRTKMSVEMRAKQFMPFHAQPGLDAALAAVETEMELALSMQGMRELSLKTQERTGFSNPPSNHSLL